MGIDNLDPLLEIVFEALQNQGSDPRLLNLPLVYVSIFATKFSVK